MSTANPPSRSIQLPLESTPRNHFLTLAIESAKNLNWTVDSILEVGFRARTRHSMDSWDEEIIVVIENESASITSTSHPEQIPGLDRNQKNLDILVNSINELKSSLSPEEINEKAGAWQEEFPKQENKFKGFLSYFVPRKDYFITPIIVNLNILVFILMVANGVDIMSPSSESLIDWGANFRPYTLDNQWWRLLTCCFLHIGLFHLAMNTYALVYIGILLEPRLGRSRFLASYLLAGIAGSVVSLWWHDYTVSAGASGAIFGMYGLFLAMLTTNLIEKSTRKELLSSIGIFVGYNLVYGLKGGIDNAAHLGGLISGLIIGYVYLPGLKKPFENKLKWRTIIISAALILVASFMVFKQVDQDALIYGKKINEFIAMEEKALTSYGTGENATTETILAGIKDHNLKYWQECLEIVESMEKLSLNKDIKTRNGILKEYCQLRIKYFELYYKGIAEDSETYISEAQEVNKKVEAKVNQLVELNKKE